MTSVQCEFMQSVNMEVVRHCEIVQSAECKVHAMVSDLRDLQNLQ